MYYGKACFMEVLEKFYGGTECSLTIENLKI